MIIVAIDLGSTVPKTAATVLDADTGAIERASVATTPASMLDQPKQCRLQRVVLACTRGSGWVVDLLRGAEVADVQVASAKDPAWMNRASTTDARDADLLV